MAQESPMSKKSVGELEKMLGVIPQRRRKFFLRGMRCRMVIFLGILTSSLTTSCHRQEPNDFEKIQFHSCRPEGIREEVLCGVLHRPENPSKPTERQIAVSVVILPAKNAHPKPDPLYIIAGGPGQSALSAAPVLARLFSAVQKERDVVLVDQRGTGKSGGLSCPNASEFIDETFDLEVETRRADASEKASERVATVEDGFHHRSISFDEGKKSELKAALKTTQPTLSERLKADEAKGKAWLLACLKKLQTKADLRFYGTQMAVEDLEAVRRAAGHGKINLWGISYGTRVVADFVRRHGDQVRSAVADGVVPPGAHLMATLGKGAARSLRKVLDACAADESCAQAFPNLEARFRALMQKSKVSPLKISGPDPLTGESIQLELSANLLAGLIRNFLYDPDLISLLPLTLDALDRGDGRTLMAQAELVTKTTQGLFHGMHFSVFCSEDFEWHQRLKTQTHSSSTAADSPLSESPLEDAPVNSVDKQSAMATMAGSENETGDTSERDWLEVLFAGSSEAEYREACGVWPHEPPPETLFQPLKSDVPFLVLSGDFDPVTPPNFGEELMRGLTNARHVVVPGASHGVTIRGCGVSVVTKFLNHPVSDGLEATCLEEMPPPRFFVSFAGPKP